MKISNLNLWLNELPLVKKILFALILVTFYYLGKLVFFLYYDKNLVQLVAYEQPWRGYLPIHLRLRSMEVDDIEDLTAFVKVSVYKDRTNSDYWQDDIIYKPLFRLQRKEAKRIHDAALIKHVFSGDPKFIWYLEFNNDLIESMSEREKQLLLELLQKPKMLPEYNSGAEIIGKLYGNLYSGKQKIPFNPKKALYFLMRAYATSPQIRSIDARNIAEVFLATGNLEDEYIWRVLHGYDFQKVGKKLTPEAFEAAFQKISRVQDQLQELKENEENYEKVWSILRKEWPQETKEPA